MTVRVYSGRCLIEEIKFRTEKLALEFASDQQDLGFRVRVV